jgi:NitT/TauT family transport system permease protein
MSVDPEVMSPEVGAPVPLQTELVPVAQRGERRLGPRIWLWTWPKLVAVGLVIAVWEYLYATSWRPHLTLPSPQSVGKTLLAMLTHQDLPDSSIPTHLWGSIQTTMGRAVTGYALALLIGTLLGIAVVQWTIFRMGVGSLVAGMQTMPSIAWFPLAILLFGITEKAILFVVILGAAPSIASGVITGIDEVPPPLLRAGKMLGAHGINRYRYIVLPAAMPSYIQGMKQGWAFSWRSLLAGELLVTVAGTTSIGSDLNQSRETLASNSVIALMIVILIIGMVIDGLFSMFAKRIRLKRGLTGAI